MTHHNKAKLGLSALQYGFNDLRSNDTSDAYKELSQDRKLECVQVAILKQLVELEKSLDRLVSYTRAVHGVLQSTVTKKKKTYVEHNHVADGMLSALIPTPKAVFIADLDESTLSVRARKCMYRIKSTGVILVADLTDDLLAETRNCGALTAMEIKEWAGLAEVANV